MEEKNAPDFVESKSMVLRNSIIEDLDAIVNARDSVGIIYSNSCGNGGRSAMLVHNNTTSKRIGVTIEIRFTYQGQPRIESRIYNIHPGQRIELGCTIPGPSFQRFNYTISGAWYI